MTRQELDVSLAYNRWANRRLLQAAAALSADQFSKDLRASFGSVRGTLVHILWGEAGWLQYWKESALHTPPDTDFRSFLTGSRYREI